MERVWGAYTVAIRRHGPFRARPWRRATRLSALAFLLTSAAFAQDQPAVRPTRPLVLNQNRYRLSAGERMPVPAAQETLEFIRGAKSRIVTVNGAQGSGFVVAPNVAGDQLLLAASLTMKPGEYAVTVSAVDKSGRERTATADITVQGLPVVPPGGSTPPVVLLNGWQLSTFPPSACPIASNGSVATFGRLASELIAPAVYFFDNCVEQSVNGSSIEELGVTLGQCLNMIQYAGGAMVPQVDLVSHSMGGLIVRSYLAGLQANDSLFPVLNPRVRKLIEIATPNFGSFLAANYSDLLASGTQGAEMVPGSGFLWTLGTWNQRGDDLRGVDALAIIGNAGYWKSSLLFPLTQLNNASDGVVSLTSASLNFARDPSRTRILPYCHIDSASVQGAFIDCTGKGIADVDEAPETGVIVLSFLANTTAWEFEGYANQTQYGGGYFALDNAAGTQYTPFSSVLLGSQAFQPGWLNTTIFYSEFVNPETGTFTATSTTNQMSLCGPFTVTGGTFSIFRCKFGPVIYSVGPLLASAAGRVVTSGGSITIRGVGFGQQCSGCQVLAYPGPVTLQVSSWTDAAIAAMLPSTFNGIAEVVVQASAGSDSITFMASPPPSPPTISLGSTQLQFTYTMGGPTPAAQSVTIANSGGGTLSWSASSGASWLSFSPPSGTGAGTLTLGINPAGLTAQTYKGAITLTAPGATNNPQTIVVSVTVNSGNTAAVVSPVSVSPGSGSGATQTFTFTFADTNGFADLAVLDILTNSYLDGIAACYVAYVPASASSGYLYLVDDAGDGKYASGSPMLFPSSHILQNTQCTISGAGSSVSASGNTLTLTLAVTFAPSFAGNKIFYTAARSNTQNLGWQALGTWNVPGAPPTGPAVGGVSPGRSVTTAQTYSFTFTDTNGYADLNVLDILTNSYLDGIAACYVAYVPTGPTTGYLYLVDNAGNGGYISGSPLLLSSGGSLQNSQCTINSAGSSASASGKTLTLNLAITFNSVGFAGNQLFYLAARNANTGNSGWQPVGSVTVP